MEGELLIAAKGTKGTGIPLEFGQTHVSFWSVFEFLNWICFSRILVWEDGYCDFYECERAGGGYMKGRFGADVFFKMSHEVYNYGEG